MKNTHKTCDHHACAANCHHDNLYLLCGQCAVINMLDLCVSNSSNVRDKAYLEGVLPDAVNLVNDLHVAGQQLAHDLDRPLLQSLRHHRVVGEGQSLRRKFKHNEAFRQNQCLCSTDLVMLQLSHHLVV